MRPSCSSPIESAKRVVLLCIVCLVPALSAEERTQANGPDRADAAESEPDWGPQRSSHFFAVGTAQETDPGGPQLEGWRVASGIWEEVGGVKVAVYVMGQTGGGQRVFGTGTDLMLFSPWKNPIRVALPLVRLGIEHRGRDPQEGINGIFGVGTEVGVWIGKSWQVSATVIREFGFPSGTRDELGINVRWLHAGDSIWDFPP